MNMKKNAIVLCSGGLDSVATAFYVKKKLGYSKITILFFNYGQKSLINERKYSKLCANRLKTDFKEIDISVLGDISTSLINKPGKISKLTKDKLKDTKKESEKRYVPCRNLVFLSYAFALAESEYVQSKVKSDIFVGFKCEGKESYPDTTSEFIESLNKIAKISCATGFEIKAPLIDKDKEDIIAIGNKIGVDFRKTFSCYIGKGKHCGECLNCMLRKQGFYWAGVEDPTSYLK